MDATYLFYDIETTGLNPCFDQILQFAAIRTDLNLNEIERHEILVKVNCDVTPTPEAMAVHGITPEQCEAGEKEIDAIKKIHAFVNKPGTISLGYNTLGFDDEFLRFSFYRNLLPPYTHQYANNCSRMDIYPMTLMYYLFKPNILKWPTVDGQTSLKLENINDENTFFEGQAHDAMVDVEITLALAKKLQQEKEIWQYLTGYFQKKVDIERLSKQTQHSLALIADGRYGHNNNFLVPAIHLGQHHHYKNQSLWLRMDDEKLQSLKPSNIDTETFSIKKRLGETPIVLPYQDRFVEKLSEKRQKQAQANLQFLQNNKPLFQNICDYHQEYKHPTVKNIDADAALYELGFPTAREDALFSDFHKAAPKRKAEIMALFPNPIRKEQALRILGRHYPEALSEENKVLFDEYLENLKKDVVDFKGRLRYQS